MLYSTCKALLASSLLLGLVGCTNDTNFSVAKVSNNFQQSVTSTKVKVDILWVIDDSGSMESSQNNLIDNFNSFIDKFQEQNFDFQMAVISTGAWRSKLEADQSFSRFKDGTDATSHTGVYVMKPDTPNLNDVFVTNARLGITGDADERGLQSVEAALLNSENIADGFLRQDALLAVIVLTDEDDFSTNGTDNVQNIPNPYDNPNLIPTSYYYDFLFEKTNSKPDNRNFIFNTIGILDDECRQQIEAGWGGRKIVQRYIDITEQSGGYLGSICDDFSDVMTGITDRIIEFTTRFQLRRKPRIETIRVYVNGTEIPKDDVNGWSYDEENMTIVFHGDAVPAQNANVQVLFDPASID